MRGVMREQFGDKARFLLCSEPPQPSVRDLFGLGSLLRGTGTSDGSLLSASSVVGGGSQFAASGGSGGAENVLDRVAARLAGGGAAEAAAYAACSGALEAALDEVEQRAQWERFRVRV
jgi:hypothetical protein